MPSAWFSFSVKVVAPVLLTGFFIWNTYDLAIKQKGIYGAKDGYSATANIALGWAISVIVILFGIIFSVLESVSANKGKTDPVPWDGEVKDDSYEAMINADNADNLF